MTAAQESPTPAKRPRPAGPRRPSRGRGLVRYQALLDATDALLRDSNPDEIGLYQIAEKAEVPPASVYHFFPTKEAAYQALAEQYLEGLLEVHSAPIEAARLRSWQDVFAVGMRRAMEFYNAHPPMLKILYGGYGGVQARNIDILVTDQMAAVSYNRLNKIFHMPFIQDPQRRFQIVFAVLDAIWTISVRRYGKITDEYLEEAFRACVACAKVFLPEVVEPREILVEATKRGQSIALPYTVEPQGV